MYLVPLNHTLKNGYSGKFYVMCILSQFKNNVIHHTVKINHRQRCQQRRPDATAIKVRGKPNLWFLGTKRKIYFKEKELINC